MPTYTEEQALDAICWSADVDGGMGGLKHYLDRLPRLRKVKIDRLFVDLYGQEVLDHLAERYPHLLVFFDAKYAEIPSKLALLAALGCQFKPWMLNCMADSLSTGQFVVTGKMTKEDLEEIDGLKRFADICHENGVLPCVVSNLTTKSEEMTQAQFGRSRAEQALVYAGLVIQAGFTHMVCSPKELAVLRAESAFDQLQLVNAGIRPAGTDKDDQINATTPRAAVDAGSNLLVVGRPITEAVNPSAVFDGIVAQLTAA